MNFGIIRRQLGSEGSEPAIAVLTKGELAIDIAMILADCLETAPRTSTSTNFVAPSLSITIKHLLQT